MFGLRKKGEGSSGSSQIDRTDGFGHFKKVVVSGGGNEGYHHHCQHSSVEWWSPGVSYEHCRRF